MSLNESQKLTSLYKGSLGVANTRTNREFFEEALKSSFTVKPNQLWKYGDLIPGNGSEESEIEKIKNLSKDDNIYTYQLDESNILQLVKYYEDISFSIVDIGTKKSFVLLENGDPIKGVIPFNYYKDVYNYTLKTSSGTEIPFGVGDWVFDTNSGVLTFYGDIPDSVSIDNPPKMSFYKYIGGYGFRNDMQGYEGALVPINNVDIAAGTFVFTSGYDSKSLQQCIIEQANKVADGFVKSYGWDGSDNNIGVATGFEIMTPLLYSLSKDKVKGYDESKDSSIHVLLTKSYVTKKDEDAYFPTILYVSNKFPEGDHVFNIVEKEDKSGATISIDNGKKYDYELNSILRIDDNLSGFIIIETSIGYEAKDYSFSTALDTSRDSTGTTTAGLFYWSIKEGKYLPFVSKEESTYDFSFPVVAVTGQIPPSVSLNTNQLELLEDSITPDYYGPRVHSVVVAESSQQSVKSADFIVKNSTGFYLNDVLKAIETKYSKNLQGGVYFRTGTYKLSSSINKGFITFGNPIIIQGEDNNSTVIDSDSENTIVIDDSYLFELKNLKFSDNISLSIYDTSEIIISNVIAKNVTIHQANDKLIKISNSSIENLTIDGVSSQNSLIISDSKISVLSSSCGYGYFYGNTIGISTFNGKNTEILSNTIAKATFNSSSHVSGNTISTLIEKKEETIFRGNFVSNYDSSISDQNGLEQANKFPIFNDKKYLKYAEFIKPLVYNSDSNSITLSYDGVRIVLNDKNELTAVIDASQIDIYNADSYPRDSSYSAAFAEASDEEKTAVGKLLNTSTNGTSKTTLENILKYIFQYKADLVSGKVPLQQLPDSVAYGGLHYCGLWSIESNKRFPQYSDVETNALKANYDTENNKLLQPGWFCIVDSSAEIDPVTKLNDPVYAQKVSLITLDATTNTYTSGISSSYPNYEDELAVEFTAGDWIIFEYYVTDSSGKKVLDEAGNYIPVWSKIDRSYQDPIYNRLSSKDPDGTDWKWDKEDNGTPGKGGIDLAGDTIYEGFNEVNKELEQLKAQHSPLLGKFTFVPSTNYPTIKCRTISSLNGLYYVPTASSSDKDFYDAGNISQFDVINSTDSDWKSYVYFGTKAYFTGYKTFNGIQSKSPNDDMGSEYTGTAITTDFMKLSDAVDSHASDIVGAGYWKGTKVTLSVVKPSQGTYGFFAEEKNITPLLQKVDSISETSTYDFVENHTISAEKNQSFVVRLNSLALSDVYTKYVSGYPFLSTSIKDSDNSTVHYKVTFSISKAFNYYVYEDKTLEYQISTEENTPWHSYEELQKNCTSVKITKNEDDSTYYDIEVDELTIDIPVVFGELTTDIKIKAFNIKGEEKIIDVYSRTDYFSDIDESERVCSGEKSTTVDITNNPTFIDTSTSTSVEGMCGCKYDSKQSLDDNIELMKTFYKKSDGTYGTHYIWPYGKYTLFGSETVTVDYDSDGHASKTGQSIQLATDSEASIYRFVTFKKDTIENSNGFTLKITGDNLSENKITGATENMFIQVLIVGDNIWYDANSPIKYLQNPTATGDACMYAGSSTASIKRVSFGQRLLSGQIVVRLGVKKDSGITIGGLTIEGIV